MWTEKVEHPVLSSERIKMRRLGMSKKTGKVIGAFCSIILMLAMFGIMPKIQKKLENILYRKMS